MTSESSNFLFWVMIRGLMPCSFRSFEGKEKSSKDKIGGRDPPYQRTGKEKTVAFLFVVVRKLVKDKRRKEVA